VQIVSSGVLNLERIVARWPYRQRSDGAMLEDQAACVNLSVNKIAVLSSALAGVWSR
jgi:hypothetical protein